MQTWPPVYTLKRHPRAKHVRLKASFRHGLELVVPKRFNVNNIPTILEQNKPWILKQQHVIEKHLTKDTVLPEQIDLHFLEQTWTIVLISGAFNLRLLPKPQQKELVLIGDIDNVQLAKQLLIRWLKQQAKKYLPTRLMHHSQQTKLQFHGTTIRGQQTRWGSCSSQKMINLNYKLLFLPLNLVDHILIHELCHTRHMNHSSQFWGLVASFDARWKEHHLAVKQTEKLVPSWVE